MERKLLLSIDGGGIRGIIPLYALMELERLTGRLTRDIFSFVAGTSVGAVITAGVAAGIRAEQLLELFVTRADDVFPQRPWNPLKRVLFGSMYSIEALYQLIRDTLGPMQDWTLNDSPIDLLVTAKRVSDGMPWYFVRDKQTNSRRTGRLLLADVVTASSAAPTYFPPWTITEDPATMPDDWEPIGTLVDGSVGVAGNPVYQTCVEAFYYSEGYSPWNTTMVSLGTGRFLTLQDPTWIGAWLGWLIGELLRSPGEQQTEIVWRHFPEMPFYRIDPDLGRRVEIDDVGSIGFLREFGARFAARIDWEAILAGEESPFLVKQNNTLWTQYCQP